MISLCSSTSAANLEEKGRQAAEFHGGNTTTQGEEAGEGAENMNYKDAHSVNKYSAKYGY